jgi:regulator of RNase E activity RraA
MAKGEILCGFARLKGIEGVAVNGAIRDTGTLIAMDLAVFARGATPRGPSSMERGVVDETMVFGGVKVSPNDLILEDDDGLVVISQAEAEQRLRPALSMVEAEEKWKRAISQGEPLLEIFKVPAAV